MYIYIYIHNLATHFTGRGLGSMHQEAPTCIHTHPLAHAHRDTQT